MVPSLYLHMLYYTYIYIYSYIGCIRPADLNISKHQEIWIQPPDNIYKYVLYNLLEVEKDREIT